MTATPRIGRKTGRPPALTRDDVARAAIVEGVATLTMPAVARRLGVAHSTLYHYVHDRDDLVLAALDLAVREFDWPAAELGWRELLTAFADALWRFLRQHPGTAEALQHAPGPPSALSELVAAYLARLQAEGLTRTDAETAVDLVTDLTSSTELAIRGTREVLDTPRGRRSIKEADPRAWAKLAGHAADHGRGWLDGKLALLLDGVASRLGEPGAPTPQPLAVAAPDAAVLDRATIVAAGRALARRGGLAAATVHAVAGELGSTPSALRREIGDRDGLVVAMLDAVATGIAVPAPASEPSAELVGLALAVHDALRADPWAVPALAVDGLASPLILPVLDRLFAAFLASGVPADEVAGAAQVVWAHVYGAALGAGGNGAFGRRMVESAESPAVAEVARVPASGRDRARLGIEIVVDGLLGRLGRAG
ncbi:TetR/AcrR family transcriptional regulator [Amycolatopsis sp.]|uniref:TetR/AcrR family transcriptional regulator n=1 Tax=Amycolatopsis sp. TaxID=37632 RepID=UPI002D7F8928|nr:TetR family transcriptional regulator [Amycolatopsis sp.]HET6704208.1 TetR family transcriptional regulator [Amycolatopsis sp.]